MIAYAGIGSRETPEAILDLMAAAAGALSRRGWTLRSGCAPGADSAFERGAWAAVEACPDCPTPELYLPWPRFEGRDRTLVRLERPDQAAFPIAAAYHPAWDRLRPAVQSLHARNVHQVLGADLDAIVPSRFVICWTRGAAGGGGTGQALRIAKAWGVPIYDLADPHALARVRSLIES